MSTLPLLLVASFALVPPSAPAGDPAPAPAPDDLERAIALLDALDTALATLHADDEPLETVLARLGEQVPLQADWPALDLIAVVRDDPVTLHLDSVPIATALATVCLQIGDVFERPIYEAYEQQIVLTTHEGAVPMRLTDVYDVRDLLVSDAALEEVRATLPPPAAPPGPDRDADEDASARAAGGTPPALPEVFVPSRDDPAPPPVRRTRGEELMALIVEHVDPDAWLGFGGTRATITEHDGVLMVSAVPGTHRRLRDALRRLRRAHLSQVSVEAAIVDLPRQAFERLRRRHDLSSAALGRAVLAAPEASVAWRTSTAAALGRRLSLDSRRDGVEVELRLVPRFDRASGLLAFDVEAETTAGADVRSLATSVTIPFRQGGAVLELPAATPGPDTRLLVLLPTRH